MIDDRNAILFVRPFIHFHYVNKSKEENLKEALLSVNGQWPMALLLLLLTIGQEEKEMKGKEGKE